MIKTMKNKYNTVLLVLLGFFVALPSSLKAQNTDTLVVPWLDGNNIAINSLYKTIMSDTVAGGARKNPNRVYKLQKGGFYYVTERIENKGWHLRIVGEKGNPAKADENPPMIQLEHRATDRTDKLISAGGSVTMKNVIVNGKTTQGDLPYEIMVFNAPNSTYTFDNVTFEYAAWGIMGFYGKDSDITITNSRFRNLASTTQLWGGRGLSVWVNVNKLRVENNTFMNIGGFGIQLEGGVGKEVWINHNTFVNVGRQVFLHGNHLNTYFTNNLVVNGFFHGEGEEGFNAVRLAEPDNQFSGWFYISELPSQFGLEVQRKIVFSHNSHFREKVYEDYYTSTASAKFPIRPQPVLNVRTKKFFDQYPAMVEGKLIDGSDPGLKRKPDNAQKQIDYVKAIRENKEPFPTWYWDPGRLNDNYSIQWPFPEDFTYTNATHLTAGFGNMPLGDLNWFPAKKAEWETKKTAIEAEIKALAGGEVKTQLVASPEAETGTASGSAKKVDMGDRFAIRVAGAGDPSWTFTMPSAGTYDISVRNRTWYAQNNPGRETNLIVNGTQVGKVTIGIEITSALEWGTGTITGVSLNAGTNTIKLGKNWGYAEYLDIQIKSGSTVVKQLWASQATDPDGAEFHCASVVKGVGKLCANGDAYLDASGGGVSLPVNITSAGQYILQFKGMVLGGGNASAALSVNGTAAGSIAFTGKDSVFVNASSNLVQLNAGANTIALGSVVGKLGVDNLYVYKVSGLGTSIDDEDTNPNGFYLSQNYPNPFNPTTNIQFNLPTAANIRLSIHNVLGQTVAVLAEGMYSSGSHTLQFNGKGLASGLYFYRLASGDHVRIRKMTMIK